MAAAWVADRTPDMVDNVAPICWATIPMVAMAAVARPIHAAEPAAQVAEVEPVSRTPAFISGVDAPHGCAGIDQALLLVSARPNLVGADSSTTANGVCQPGARAGSC